MKCIGMVATVLLGVLAMGGAQAQNPQTESPPGGNSGAAQSRWQPPPPPATWTAAMHHGYMDGVEAAWIDLAHGLRAKPSRHLMYKHPAAVKIDRRYEYRDGFRKGYAVVYRHEKGHAQRAKG